MQTRGSSARRAAAPVTETVQSSAPPSQWRKPLQGGNDPFVKSCQICSVGQRGTYIDYQLFGRASLEKWPQHTEVCCWNDGEPFGTPPVPLPFAYDEARSTFEVCGVFCSVACAKRYALDTHGYQRGLQLMWLSQICDLIFKDPSLADTRPAPPRNTLARYGGHLALEDYRTEEFRGRVELLSRPLVSYPIVAHIAPTQGQMGQVTGLRRPTSRQVRGTATAAAPEAAKVGPGLLDDHAAVEGKGGDGEETKQQVPAAPVRRRGGLTQFLRPRGSKPG
jgi:hypothetical protein